MTRPPSIAPNTYAAFVHLRDHGPCRVSAIAELLGIRSNQVTAHLKIHIANGRLTKAGYGLLELTAIGADYLMDKVVSAPRCYKKRAKFETVSDPNPGDRADYRGTAMAPDEIAAIHGSRRYTDATEADVRRLMAKTGPMKVHNVDVSKGARRSGVAGFGDSQLARVG
jgi:hypothetical protein